MNAPYPADAVTHPFDAATALEWDGPGRARGRTSPGYWAFVGPFGGFTAAVLLRAVLEHPDAMGDALAITVNYCAPVEEGPFEVAARCERANRSTQHWSVALSQGGAEPAATATVVLAARRESWSHQPAAMPTAGPLEATPLYAGTNTAKWPGRYAFRFVSGGPEFAGGGVPGPTRTEVWISDATPRTLDALSLTAIGDAFFGRIFHAQRGIVPFGTVSMTTHFHVSAEELATDGATAVLGVADARTFHRSYGDQTAELWSPSGRLLATSSQVFYFKA
jgi:hypothetical protein